MLKYVVGIAIALLSIISTYLLHKSIENIGNIYSLANLLLIYESLNYTYLIAFTLILGIAISLNYFILKLIKNNILLSFFYFLYSLPIIYLGVSYLPLQQAILFAVITLPLAYIGTYYIIRDSEKYKIIPFDEINIRIVKIVYLLSTLTLLLFLFVNISNTDAQNHTEELFIELTSFDSDQIQNIENELINKEIEKVSYISNATLLYAMYKISEDAELSYQDRAICTNAINKHKTSIIKELENNLRKQYSEGLPNSNVSNIQLLKDIYDTIEKYYKYIVVFYIYLLLQFSFFFIFFIAIFFSKLYKILDHN